MEESSLSNNIHVNAAFEYEDETKSEKKNSQISSKKFAVIIAFFSLLIVILFVLVIVLFVQLQNVKHATESTKTISFQGPDKNDKRIATPTYKETTPPYDDNVTTSTLFYNTTKTDNATSSHCNKTTAFNFPRSDQTTDYIRILKPIPLMHNLTICTWVKSSKEGGIFGPFLSYATQKYYNAFLILGIQENSQLYFQIFLRNVHKNLPYDPLLSNSDYHMCVTLRSDQGLVKIYLKGRSNVELEESFEEKHTVPGGGVMIIGQEQDSYLGSFAPDQVLSHSTIENYMIWDRVLSENEIEEMSKSVCVCAKDPFITLSLDMIQLHGAVSAYTTPPC